MTIPTSGAKVEGSGLTGPGSLEPTSPAHSFLSRTGSLESCRTNWGETLSYPVETQICNLMERIGNPTESNLAERSQSPSNQMVFLSLEPLTLMEGSQAIRKEQPFLLHEPSL